MLDGLGDFQRKLNDVAANAQRLHGTNHVKLADLLNDGFVASRTHFLTLDEMTAAFGPDVNEATLQTPEWSAFVAARTSFSSWDEMKQQAANEWAIGELGL